MSILLTHLCEMKCTPNQDAILIKRFDTVIISTQKTYVVHRLHVKMVRKCDSFHCGKLFKLSSSIDRI